MKTVEQQLMYHHSHLNSFRKPFGAVAAGTNVTISLVVTNGLNPTKVELVLMRDREAYYAMEQQTYGGHGDSYGQLGQPVAPAIRALEQGQLYQVQVKPANPGLWWYYFRVETNGATYYYGNNHLNRGGEGQVYPHVPPAFQLTVYMRDTTTPNWYKEGVMYQIFVERFHNGTEDGSVLNPKPGSLIHAHWDDQPVYIRDCRDHAVVRWDFFGGNLLGVLKKLPYLKELGVTVLYLNPIFEASSNHKYDTGDYHKIDAMYGDEETFTTLCQVAGEMGINILLDGVFSHTGSDSIYFNREGNYPELGAYQSTASPYHSWFRFHEYPNKYESWWGVDALPNVEELDPSYQEFMVTGENAVVKKWLRLGAKGWRLDVVDELPGQFVKLLRQAVKEVDQEAIVLGEVWEDASNKVSYDERREYLLGQELDSTMNYPFRDAFNHFLLQWRSGDDAQGALVSLWENYPLHHFYSTMNLVGTHDTVRILTLLGTGSTREDMAELDLAQLKLSPQERRLGIDRLKLLSMLQFTFPGVPSIYYGDEAGMEGYRDPLCRGTYPWGREDQELVTWHKELSQLRHRYPVLKTGQWLPLYLGEQVYGFGRKIGGGQDVFGQARPDNTAVVLVNRNPGQGVELRIDVGHWCEGPLTVALTTNAGEDHGFHYAKGAQVELNQGQLSVNLPALGGLVLLAKVAEADGGK